MRGLLSIILVTATSGINLIAVALPAWAECPCMKPHWDEVRRAQRAEQYNHLPSQSDLVTARGFAIEKMPIDAANYYSSASQKAEQEIQDALHKNATNAAAMPLDQVTYLLEHAIEIENEAILYFERSGKNISEILPMQERIFQHHLDANDLTGEDKSKVAMELAGAKLQKHDSRAAAAYYKIALDELQQTRGRYSPDVVQLQAQYRRLLAKSTLSSM